MRTFSFLFFCAAAFLAVTAVPIDDSPVQAALSLNVGEDGVDVRERDIIDQGLDLYYGNECQTILMKICPAYTPEDRMMFMVAASAIFVILLALLSFCCCCLYACNRNSDRYYA